MDGCNELVECEEETVCSGTGLFSSDPVEVAGGGESYEYLV